MSAQPHASVATAGPPGLSGNTGGVALSGRATASWVVALLALLVVSAGLGYAASFLVAPAYTSSTSMLPPQQQQSATASALASLGALAGLGGAQGGVKSAGDQYVALMQSNTVSDRIIEAFGLQQAYEARYLVDARQELARNVRFSVGRKDGMIVIEVDDTDPKRAASMANRYVDELRRLTGTLAVSEAQQRRAFFEQLLLATKDKLIAAQLALQSSGFSQGALRAEPKAAADGYAKLRAEVMAAEVRLRGLRSSLADNTPEVRQQQVTLQSLQAELARTERAAPANEGPGYVALYREFKYQETLFDLFARQYELARVDESREGALIQVVDKASPAEKASRPRRARMAAAGAAFGALLAAAILSIQYRRRNRHQPAQP
jgi:uncharacterized protein involved in exopolysaccharide biosynthesis